MGVPDTMSISVRRSVSALLASGLLLSSAVAALPASAAPADVTYTSPTSTLSFQLGDGWDPQPFDVAQLGGPWTEAAQAVFPADGRVTTVATQPLSAEMSVDDAYKAMMDQD